MELHEIHARAYNTFRKYGDRTYISRRVGEQSSYENLRNFLFILYRLDLT